MPTQPSPTDRSAMELRLKRIAAALLLLFLIFLQIISISLNSRVERLHNKPLHCLEEIRIHAITAHLLLEEILAGEQENTSGLVEDRLNLALEQAGLLSAIDPEKSLLHQHSSGSGEPVREIAAHLEALRSLSRQRLGGALADAVGTTLVVQYHTAFRQMLERVNSLEGTLRRHKELDEAFLFEIQFGLIMASVVLALFTILLFHRHDVARKRAMETIAEKKEREQFTSHFSRFCRDSVAMEPVYEMITSWLGEHLGVDLVSVWMFQDDGTRLSCSCRYALADKTFSQGMAVSVEQFSGYIAALKQDVPIVAEDARTHPVTRVLTESYFVTLDIQSLLDIPLKHEGKTIGVLCLETQGKSRQWISPEIDFCVGVAAQLSIAFSRIKERALREKAQADYAIVLEKEVGERTVELEVANKTLRESETRLQLTFNMAPFGALLVDPQGKILKANNEFCRMIGYTEEELARINFFSLTHPDSRQICNAGLTQLLAGDLKEFSADKQYPCKDGGIVWGRTTVRLVRDEAGAPSYFLPIIEDVSEWKLYENRLKRLYTAIEQSPLSVVITDPDGNIEYANPFFSAVTGYPLAEVIGKNPSVLRSGVHDAGFYSNMWQTITAGKTWQGEMCSRKKDGSLFWEYATLTPVTDNNGMVVSYIAVKEDISERKQLIDALKERTEVLTSIASAALSAIIMMDSDGCITFWNKAAEQIFGWSQEEALGQDLHRLISPDFSQKRFRENFARFRQSGEGEVIGNRVEVVALRKDGAEFPVELSLSALQIKNQWHAVGLVNDITVRKESEEALFLARDAAEKANRAKSDFLSRMSHEIRTPMNAIIGLSHLALEMELPTKLRDYLVKISTSGKNLLCIINDILDFSKIEAQKLEIEHHPFSLEKVLADLAGITSIKAQEKGVEFMFSVDPEVPDQLVGDAMRLGQVLLNLTSNAIKFTDHGEVVVDISVMERTPGRLVLLFSVRDTGTGLSEEQMGRLFAPFSQGDGSISRTHGGTGLGLVICKRLVALMGGELQVESVPGQGSTFSFIAVLREQPDADTSTCIPHPDLRGLRVLVVEDNPTTRVIFQRALESFSFKVEVAASGEEGLEVLRRRMHEKPFDLFLLDYLLPGIQGDQVARAVREAQGVGTTAKILLVTSTGSEEIVERCFAAGCDGVLHKPVSRSTLFDAIMGLYGQSCLDDAPAEHRRQDFPQHRFKDAKILLVEDNEINQQVAREILERAGMVVNTAENGEAALTMVLKNKYDLVLMDIQMPGMDGLEATRRIRASGVERLATLPIVAMTAHAMKGDEALSLASGMNGHITKPIEPKILFATLAQWLPAKEAPVESSQPPGEIPAVEALLLGEIPGLDLALGLERLGDARLYRNILRQFAEKYVTTANTISGLIQQQQWEEAGQALHALKGVVGTICAQKLFDLTVELEKACQAHLVSPELLGTFKESHAALIQTLQAALSLAPPPFVEARCEASSIDPVQLRTLLAAMLPDLRAHRPVQCSEHVARINTAQWPVPLQLEKNDLIRAVGNYQFRQALRLAERLLSALESGGAE